MLGNRKVHKMEVNPQLTWLGDLGTNAHLLRPPRASVANYLNSSSFCFYVQTTCSTLMEDGIAL
ncbi:hypothetical protein HanIR_Chr04g0194821 [Helianthus annuus]|nr:hypothetical protein HanIR_Chr04g0194821 [Helianthus annuus]